MYFNNHYFLLENEDHDEQANTALTSTIFSGVYPSRKVLKKLQEKYQDNKDNKEIEFSIRILEQNKKLVNISNSNYEKSQSLNADLDNALSELSNILTKISLVKQQPVITPSNEVNEVQERIQNFTSTTEKNKQKIKKLMENIPDLQRKKKENEEYFKKYEGEKQVWLDRLNEDLLQEEAYEKGFKYLYEAKTIKLLIEGILLEKVQDKVEKSLSENGEMFGWGLMNTEKRNEERKKEEFNLNKELLGMTDEEAAKKEQEQRKKFELEDKRDEQKKIEIQNEWKRIYNEIWIPNTQVSNDPDIKNKRDFVIKTTMEETFKMFQKLCFDVWKFKNTMLSKSEYIIMDKIRSYFPDKNIPGRMKDEIIVNQLMDIIDEIKSEEEIIYCDLTEAKKKVEEYSKATTVNTTAIERLTKIIEKITTVQKLVNENPYAFVRAEIEEINSLLKEITDDKEKKLFCENLIESPRLFDIFLPLTNILMVITFSTVGKKRDRNYQGKLNQNNEDINKLKEENNEINGKITLLKQVKEKEENEKKNVEKEEKIIDNTLDEDDKEELIQHENFNIQDLVNNAKACLDKIIEIKNQQQDNSLNLFKEMRKVLIKPKDLC